MLRFKDYNKKNVFSHISSSNIHHTQTQRGNIFFALFGAVAIVGLLGTAVVSTMRGPLSTMVKVQSTTQAESEMSIASRLVMLEAVEQGDDGDCDADGFVEPLEYKDAGGLGPVGGGFIPDSVASARMDPWGTEYGYCAWDAGASVGAISCDLDGNASNERLNGNADASDETYTVIAIISAGPDQVFDASTACIGGASPAATKGGDDLLVSFSYASARGETDGLWNIKEGDATTAEISKNLEISGSATFSAGIDLTGSSAALRLGAASMILPTDDEAGLGDADCPNGGANIGMVRINDDTTPDQLEICDSGGWTTAGASASLWFSGAGDDIYYNSGTPQVGIGTAAPSSTLHVVGSTVLGGSVNATGAADFDSTLNVDGATTLAGTTVSTLNATGAADFDSTLNVDGATTLAGTAVSTLNATGAVDFDSALNVDGNAVFGSAVDFQGNISSSTQNVTIVDNTTITGQLDSRSRIFNFSGNLNLYDSVDILEDLNITEDLNVTLDADIDGTLETDALTVQGNNFVPGSCASGSFNRWSGSAWVCENDTAGSGGAAIPDHITSDDGNTRVHTNETANENFIRFDTAGTERMYIDPDGDISINGATLSSGINILNKNMQFTDTSSGGISEFLLLHKQNSSGSAGIHFKSGTSSGNDAARIFANSGSFNLMAYGDMIFRQGSGFAEVMRLNTADNFGIGDFSSDTIDSRLHIQDGDITLDGGAGDEQGCLRFNDSTNKIQFSHNCTDFTDMAGAGGGSSLWTDNTTHISRGRLHILDSGETTDTAGLSANGGASDGYLMVIDTDKSAFHAGEISGGNDAFDAANIGINSLAWGWNTQASGPASIALGPAANSTGTYTVAIGDQASATGDRSIAVGGLATGAGGISIGGFAGGQYSRAMGRQASASNIGTLALGYGVDVNADYSVGISAGDNYPSGITTPVITGTNSMGIFLGQQDGAVMTETNTLGVIGGQILVDNDATTGSEGCLSYNGGTSRLQFSHDCSTFIDLAGAGSASVGGSATQVQYNTGGAFAGDAGMTYNATTDTLTLAGGIVVPDDGIAMATTNTAGHILVNDGGEFNPVAVSGDATLATDGALTIANEAITEVMLDATGTLTDEFCLTWEDTGAQFEWQSCGGGGGSSLWTDNTTHISRGRLHILDSGATTDSAGLSANGGGANGYLIAIDTDKGSMNGGRLDSGNDAFDNANLGLNSLAWGYNAQAGNVGTIALGVSPSATGLYSVAIGTSATATGQNSIAIGGYALAEAATALGGGTSSGQFAVSLGRYAVAQGFGSMALGYGVYVPGSYSVGISAGSNYPTGITTPSITGNNSMGIFLGQHDAAVMTETQTLGVYGTQILIDNDATTGSEGCLRYNGTDSELQYAHDCTNFVRMGDGYGTEAMTVPAGTLAQRPTGVNGMIRYRTDGTIGFEVFESSAWVALGSAVSDRRLKHNIEPLSPDTILEKLSQVGTYSYSMKNDDSHRKQYGVIAQDLQKIFPELVDGDAADDNNKMSVRYNNFIAMLITATNTLKTENVALSEEISTLKQENLNTQARLEQLEKNIALLNKHGVNNTGKASSLAMIMMLMGLLGLSGVVFYKRRTA